MPISDKVLTDNIRANSLREGVCNLRDLEGAASGRPCFLLGTGPSFNAATYILGKAIAGGFDPLVISVDRGLPYAQRLGVFPQLTVAIDYQAIAADLVKPADTLSTVLVANTAVNPAVPKFFPDVVWYNVAPVAGRPVENAKRVSYALFPRADILQFSPGLVGGEALMVANFLRPDKIILIGFDCWEARGPQSKALAGLARFVEIMVPNFSCPVWNCSGRATISAGVECMGIDEAIARLT